jgi:hypothetical protein
MILLSDHVISHVLKLNSQQYIDFLLSYKGIRRHDRRSYDPKNFNLNSAFLFMEYDDALNAINNLEPHLILSKLID